MTIKAERIELGEEVGFDYVRDVLRVAIQQWNHAMEQMIAKAADPEALLSKLDQKDTETEASIRQSLEELFINATESLQRIDIKPSDSSFLILDIDCVQFFYIHVVLGTCLAVFLHVVVVTCLGRMAQKAFCSDYIQYHIYIHYKVLCGANWGLSE